MATLAVYRGEQLLRKVELGDGPMRIGRAPENEIVLEDPNKGVSRSHAEIRYEDGRYIILDLNSQNGVWIRDHRVRVDPLPVDVPVTVGPYRLVLLPTPVPSSGTSIPGTVISSLPPVQDVREPTARVQTAESTEGTERDPKTSSAAGTQKTVRAASPPPNKRLLVAAVVVAAVVVIAVIVMMMMRQPPPPPTVAANPPVAPATTTVPPTGPTDQERFQELYARAQAFIEKGDKAAAAAENTAALAVLPSDPQGLKQRADIEAMSSPAAPAPAPTPAAPVANAGRENKPAPPASTLTVAARPGESAADRLGREKIARYHLDDGKKAMDERRYVDAIELLQRALDASDRPDFGYTAGEAAGLIKTARNAKAQADASLARANAQKLVDQAKTLAGTDIVSAARRLREAVAIDPKAPGAAELMATLQDQLVAQGEAALTSAKNFDRYKRITEAIREYDRAAQFLELVQGGHKDLAFAKQRSAELKTPR